MNRHTEKTDAQIIEELRQSLEAQSERLIHGFTEAYDAVIYGRISDNSYRVLANKDAAIPKIEYTPTFDEGMRSYVSNFVHPDDAHLFDGAFTNLSIAAGTVPIEEVISVEYRSRTEGDYVWYRASLRRISEDEVLLGFKNCDSEIIQKLISDKLMAEYEALYIADLNKGRIRPARASSISEVGAFTEISDYESRFANFAKTVAPEYRDDWLRFGDTEYMKQYMAEEDHREYIFKLPGAALSLRRFSVDVLERNDGEAAVVLFSFVGIDEKRASQIEMENESKRAMSIITAMTEDFDEIGAVNIRTGELTRYVASEKFLRAESKIDPGLIGRQRMDAFLKNVVHPDDWEFFTAAISPETLEKELEKDPVYKIECRALLQDDKDEYYRFQFARMPGEPDLRIVGLLNIDENVRREQELAVARQKAEREQEIRRSYMQASFRAEALQYIVDSECTAPEFLEHFADRLLELADCDRILYRDIDGNSYAVDAPGLGDEYKTPEEYCAECEHTNIRSPIYRDGEIVEDDCSTDPLINRSCPVKSKMTRLVYLDGEPYGYLSLHYLKNRHTFTEEGKQTFRELAGSISLAISRVMAKEKTADLEYELYLKEQAEEQVSRIMGLSDDFQAIYDVDYQTGEYNVYSYDNKYADSVLINMENGENFYKDTLSDVERVVYSEDRDLILNAFSNKDYIGKELDGHGGFAIEYRLLSGGEPAWYRVKVIRKPGAADRFLVGIFNIDDRKREEAKRQKELEDALVMAQSANRAKTAFMNSMSHDIRTPMNAITGYTRMAKKSLEDTWKVSDYLDKIDVSGQQLLSLINQVLEMSRIESGKVVLKEEPADVVEKAYAMQAMCGADVERKGLNYRLTVMNVPHRFVLTDASRMSQIMTNIIGNAIKYTPEGGTIDYTVEELPCDKEGYGLYRFTVADTGIGMSEEYQKHLFEEFTRENTSTVNNIQGTGLGMSIVKRLAELMGGRIDVKSKLGEGTTIAVSLPMKLDDSMVKAGEKEAAYSKIEFTGKRLLLVEDNEMNREIALDILEDAGFIVETAEDGDIALEKLRKVAEAEDYYYYDAVLMDIQMPRMNGYEATKAIRDIQVPEGIRLPIIALSANAFEEDRQKSLSAGMDDHIAKPIDIQKLKETLAKYM